MSLWRFEDERIKASDRPAWGYMESAVVILRLWLAEGHLSQESQNTPRTQVKIA